MKPEFYEGKVKGLGRDFLKEIQHAVIAIRESPQRFPKKTKSTRHCLLKRFPYSIVFLEHKETIFIVAIAHGRRKPNYWRNKI